MSLYWIVFGKACHLLVEIEHHAYWALQELQELYLEAYENSQIYKPKDPEEGVQSRPEGALVPFLIAGKLCSRWDRQFVITNVFPYGAIELKDEASNTIFQVSGH
ncbi:hypothetical protein CR513_03724, partial [Mucuna pruriens]